MPTATVTLLFHYDDQVLDPLQIEDAASALEQHLHTYIPELVESDSLYSPLHQLKCEVSSEVEFPPNH